ncbi:expressed hypothetical protein [Trichoplax adhaerens]|uniref:CYTH domain-containing protein n=1 Tax=Trichoplax adhaerens TaxID=10228 RepID=B3RX64_TRIAD|nr:expressed hypothetical protein [Trichoplax adhaerens]EDV24816.1 expressed hypothetical protein [Trichoplax adhaerens]|eukprot:XP_002112706.1 expressed hypothetical protein [Trichoplax adhaerens]
MASNVEIKAKVTDIEKLKHLAKEVSGQPGKLIEQEDTFFLCDHGRLKLRKFPNGQGELIFYSRADQSGPKLSNYHITKVTENTDDLIHTLDLAYGIRGVVKKKRYLYLVGQTRVHVDTVDGLGNFMELEVVMKKGQSCEEGQAIAEDLMAKLEIAKAELLTSAYIDMLQRKS